jgi:hypothetical protein
MAMPLGELFRELDSVRLRGTQELDPQRVQDEGYERRAGENQSKDIDKATLPISGVRQTRKMNERLRPKLDNPIMKADSCTTAACSRHVRYMNAPYTRHPRRRRAANGRG